MPNRTSEIRIDLWVPEPEPTRAFERLVSELRMLSARRGVRFDLRAGGAVRAVGPDGAERTLAVVKEWEPGRRASLEWSTFEWDPESPPLRTELEVIPADEGTRISFRCANWSASPHFRDADELLGWFASGVVRPLALSLGPEEMGDWVTDRGSRRPTGSRARQSYSEPIYHLPNFRLIRERLALTADDRLLEVGCGGGAFLREALASGCRAQAVDHSPEMVETALEVNREAVREGRLEVREADAASLPFADASSTCAVSTGVFHFLPDPDRALREIYRVLRPGGRLILFVGSKVLRGTPAAPEPVASRLRWYEDEELAELARHAGFTNVRVDRPDFVPYARAAGLPEEAIAFFASTPRGGQVLEARRPGDGVRATRRAGRGGAGTTPGRRGSAGIRSPIHRAPRPRRRSSRSPRPPRRT